MMPALVREGRLTGFAMRYLGRLVAYLAVFFITFSLGYTLLLRWVPVTLTPLKAIRLADMASIVDADVYIHSHTHLPMVMKQGFYRTCEANRSVAPVSKLFVNTAAALDYGGYGEIQEYKPTSKDTPVIYLDGHKRGMTARL